jgi:hypothetical protein
LISFLKNIISFGLILFGFSIEIIHAQNTGAKEEPVFNFHEGGFEQIAVPGGPEDIVFGNNGENNCLFISCANRTNDPAQSNEIALIFDLDSVAKIMTRINEPDSLFFKPHGIDFRVINEIPLLYVISHDDRHNFHPVVRYIINGETLVYDTLFYDPSFISPNDLTICDDGSFYFVNDAGKRGSKFELFLMLKRGSVVYHDGRSESEMVARRIGMPAGVFADMTHVYVSAATENRIYRYKKNDNNFLGEKELFSKMPSPDNFSVSDSLMIVSGHKSKFKFIKHVNDPENFSPSIVYGFSRNGKVLLVDEKNGEFISGVSVAVMYGTDTIILGQIFKPYLLKVSRN